MPDYINPPKTIKKFFEAQGQRLAYDKKQVLVRADDPQPWVYFLAEGIVEVTYSFDYGTDRILGYLVPNIVFAQNRLFFQEEDGALTYTAIEKTVVYRAHYQLFLTQLKKSHAFTTEYLKNTQLMRIFTTDFVIYQGEELIYNRCVRWLLLMVKYYGEPTDAGIQIIMPLTQDVIANFLHASRESVSKTLRELIRGGYISVAKKRITITDTSELKKLLR